MGRRYDASGLLCFKVRMRRLLIPGLTVLLMLCVLVGLGTWQMQRLAWKQDILDTVAAAEAQPAALLENTYTPFAKVHAEGRFRPDLVAALGAELRGTQPGVRMLAVLERVEAPPVLVDLGFAPLPPGADVASLLSYLPHGYVRVTGYLRPADAIGYFAAADDAAARRFYTFNPVAIGAALDVPGVASFALVRLGEESAYPIPAQHLPRPANNHLSYALTWYGLAITLLVVFLLWARRKPEPS